MAVTKTTDLTNSVVTRYEKEYLLTAVEKPGVWGQFIDWQSPIPESGGGGSTIDFPIYSEQDLVEDALTEDADVQPDTISDGNVTLTPQEYGKTFAISKKARYLARTPVEQVLGKLVSQNRTKSIDRIIRRSATGWGATRPSLTLHVDGSATMASLTAASNTDKITYAFLMELAAQAASMDLEPFEGTGFHAIIHPLLALDIKSLDEWKNVGYYQDKMQLYGALEKPFTMAGITFIPSTMGRVYLGAGTAVQTATTLSAGANKGATTRHGRERHRPDRGRLHHDRHGRDRDASTRARTSSSASSPASTPRPSRSAPTARTTGLGCASTTPRARASSKPTTSPRSRSSGRTRSWASTARTPDATACRRRRRAWITSTGSITTGGTGSAASAASRSG